MNKLFFALSAAAFVSSINVAVAADRQDAVADTVHEDMPATAGTSGMKMNHGKGMMNRHGMDMKAMDTNGDGMISKEEFMAYHEAMYDHMKKNKDGMVDMKDMGMMGSNKGEKVIKGNSAK